MSEKSPFRLLKLPTAEERRGGPTAVTTWSKVNTETTEDVARANAEAAASAPATLPDVPSAVPESDRLLKMRVEVQRAVIRELGSDVSRASQKSDADLQQRVLKAVTFWVGEQDVPMARGERDRIIEQVYDDILGYGPIEPYLRDETITEVMVNNWDSIYIERRGLVEKTETRFNDNEHLIRIIDKIVTAVGRRIDEGSPMVDARLPDGSRVNAIIPPLAVTGPCMTIRKFRADPFKMDDLVRSGTFSPDAARFLELAVKGKANILVSGGTGSGKTTTLNVLSSAIPDNQRIVTVEDSAELQLSQEHVITLESRNANTEGRGEVGIRDLVRNCLRMRPDRIIVGECRGPETVDMLQAMNTGHDGSLTTVHSNGPRDTLSRLETLVLTAGVDLPVRSIREQIAGALDLIVHVSRLVDGTRRVTHIVELTGMEGDAIQLQELFVAKPAGGEESSSAGGLLGPLQPTGIVPSFLEKLSANNTQIPIGLFQRPARRNRSEEVSSLDSRRKPGERKRPRN